MENKFYKLVYEMQNALNNMNEDEKLSLATILSSVGIDDERIKEVNAFIFKNIDKKNYKKLIKGQSIVSYIESFTNLEKYIRHEAIGKGYQEMSEINKQISEEYFHLENEGEKLNHELDSTKTENKTS